MRKRERFRSDTQVFEPESDSDSKDREGLRTLPLNSFSTGEFDPGSERTLAARLTHASRTRGGNPESGARVRNT